MARYGPPIPALFATIHPYPSGEVERLNHTLEDRFQDEKAAQVGAAAIIEALPALSEAKDVLKGSSDEQSAPHVCTKWADWLLQYEWANVDYATNLEAFRAASVLLTKAENDDQVVEAARCIFEWGRVRPRSFSAMDVHNVLNAAIGGQTQGAVPWSSSWTKIAAAATHDADFDPESACIPHVIWDSRVSYAVARLLTTAREEGTLNEDSFARLQRALLLVQGRGGTRIQPPGRRRSGEDGATLTEALNAKGWRMAAGSWKARSRTFWRSQVAGSRIVHEVAGQLNAQGCRAGHARWTTFSVGAVLFAYGR